MKPEELGNIKIIATDDNEGLSSSSALHLSSSRDSVHKSEERINSRKGSDSRLLGQMENILNKTDDAENSDGVLVVTVHRALNIEKKGFVGKADPYVQIQVVLHH